MTSLHPIAKLQATHSNLEVWFDSSPLVYEDWVKSTTPTLRAGELFEMKPAPNGTGYFASNSLLRGATTNQPLTLQVIQKNPVYWTQWLKTSLGQASSITAKEAMWRVFIEIAARGADMLHPIAKASNYCSGQICCQVDPRDMTSVDMMVDQARRIHAARPNIMVKMPGTKEGIEGVRILTAEGVPTNVTLGFTVPQLIAVGEAAQAGLAEAKRRGANLRYWQSCAVMMLGRYEDHPLMQTQAQERGIHLTEADLRWAGIAIFRKAHKIFGEKSYPSKLMAASMRLGPILDGVTHVWHLEKLAGANAVLTVFPNIFEVFLAAYTNLPIEAQIDEPVPAQVLERLLQIPYFAEAYDEHGIVPENFVDHPALQATASSFADAMNKIEIFATASLVNQACFRHPNAE
jgi:transaldolase